MSVIRHGEVIEVVYDAERIVVHAPACASHADAVCDCEPAAFVPADQLTGAVDALTEWLAADDDAERNYTPESEARLDAAIRVARAIVRGQ
jgi:hypothetical protein